MEFCFKCNEYENIKDELTTFLKRMTDGENVQNKIAAEIILDIVEKCKNTKLKGNDDGHYINNIGFNEKILSENVRKLYKCYKRNKII